MAKIALGKTPQDLEAERAKRDREIEAEIQQSIMERQRKIQALHKKQKQNKIIIICSILAISIILLVFGTYNTFFKKGLTMDEVNRSINVSLASYRYPSEGLDDYIRTIAEPLFNRYMSLNNKSKNIEYVKVDKNSVGIIKVRKLSSTLAQVYFAFDVEVKEKDSVVTDPVTIEQLKKNGFGIRQEIKNKDSNVVKETEESKEEQTKETKVDDTTTETTETTENKDSETEVETETETETELELAITNNDDVAITSMVMENTNGELVNYYATPGGTIMRSGNTTTQRYNFYVPVEFVYGYDGDKAVTSGYSVAGEMNLYSLNETNVTTFEDDILVNSVFAFVPETRVDEDTLNKVQIKVSKTLEDLYNLRDTSQDFLNYRTFNTYNAKFDSLNYIEMYTQPNSLGYNTYVVYTITTPQGFSYQCDAYLYVEQSGNSYVIKQFM